MIKTYKASSVIAFTTLGIRVSFIPLSTGGSYFITDNEDLQKAIESHHWFGTKIYREKSNPEEDNTPVEINPEQPKDSEIPKESDSLTPKEQEPMEFENADDAKEYVANTFGVERTKMKKTGDIIKCALDNGLTIIIKE